MRFMSLSCAGLSAAAAVLLVIALVWGSPFEAAIFALGMASFAFSAYTFRTLARAWDRLAAAQRSLAETERILIRFQFPGEADR